MVFKSKQEESGAADLGRRISKLRKEKGWTQEQLAEMLNVSPQAVSKWENGNSCPDITLLPVIAKLFGVTVDELFGVVKSPVVAVQDEGSRRKADEMVLRIRVLSIQGDKVNINLPMKLVKAGLKIGESAMSMPKVKAAMGDADIDLEAIIEAVESGVTGKLVEVESSDGDIVEITVE